MSTEHGVGQIDTLQDGQMTEVEAAGRKILLLRLDGEYHAFAGTCPHAGGSLAEGLLCDGHVRCPWHQAVFDARTGALREPPALDGLVRYEVRVEGGEIIVVLPDEPAESVQPAAVGRDLSADGRTFVVLGGGAVGATAVETLRQRGFEGEILLITKERHLPYDRTALSKGYLKQADVDSPVLRSQAFYDGLGIEVLTGREAVSVDVAAKTIACRDGRDIRFDRLLLATGAAPRRLGVDGEDLENVFALRSLDSCERIRRAVDGARRAVVVGAGFIGMEVAAALTERGLGVTVVAPEAVPFEAAFGEQIGRMYQQVHEEKGVDFQLGTRVKHFEGDGRLRAVVLADGRRLDADLAVVGVGVRPVTEYLEDAAPNDDGSVTVDAQLRLAADVWAAGDIARFPDWRSGEPIRIEHWRVAMHQGRVAAANMAGGQTAFRGVPFFWTNQHWVITQYVGHCRKWDEIVFDGDPRERNFLAFYVRDGGVRAVTGCERDRAMAAAAERLAADEPPTVEEFRRWLSGV